MIIIGKPYIERVNNWTRLCSDIQTENRQVTLWMAVRSSQEDMLCTDRVDSFVVLLLPEAMRSKRNLFSDSSMSEKLHYQLREHLIPALTSAGDLYHNIQLDIPTTSDYVPRKGVVATGFSGGVDSLYSIYSHGVDSEYPVTHLVVSNSGVYEGSEYRERFYQACFACESFAREQGLKTIFIDSNIYEILPERYIDVVSLRLMAFALALQDGIAVYLLSSGFAMGNFRLDVHRAAKFDPLSVNCLNTEKLQFYLSGSEEVSRIMKIKELTKWPPSYRWVSPCVNGRAGKKNCGRCSKCMRDLAVLYAYGALDLYSSVYDIEDFRRHLSERLGFVMAENYPTAKETVRILEESNVYIPPMAYRCADAFRKYMYKVENER